jgi:hypothetical protein
MQLILQLCAAARCDCKMWLLIVFQMLFLKMCLLIVFNCCSSVYYASGWKSPASIVNRFSIIVPQFLCIWKKSPASRCDCYLFSIVVFQDVFVNSFSVAGPKFIMHLEDISSLPKQTMDMHNCFFYRSHLNVLMTMFLKKSWLIAGVESGML